MKKTIVFVLLAGALFTSCMKKKTCTCYKGDGSADGKTSKSSTSKSDMKAFEDACKSDSEKRKALYGGEGRCELN